MYNAADISRIMAQYDCHMSTAIDYLNSREEGYTVYQSKLMSGLIDPPDEDDAHQHAANNSKD